MYLLIARDIRERSDAWLSGEAEVLADVSANTPRDALYDRLVEEVAELASREVPDASDATGKHQSFRFLSANTTAAGTHLGRAESQGAFHRGDSEHASLPRECRLTCTYPGWKKAFRVVYHAATMAADSIWDLPISAERRCWID